MLVSFSCYHCAAVLSIPEEQSGISGPCPYCGTIVTSPAQDAVPVEAREEFAPDTTAVANPAVAAAEKPLRDRFPSLLMSVEQTVLRPRPRHVALKVAAGLALFAGGVAGVWKIWESDRPMAIAPSPEEPAPLPVVPRPRPAALAVAGEPAPDENDAESGSENEVPPIPPLSVPGVVIRDVSANMIASPAVTASTRGAALSFPDTPVVRAASPGVTVPAAPMSEEEKEIRRIVSTSGPLAAPGNALVRFLAAKNWQERLQYTLAPQKVKPLMEAYYKSHPDGPVVPEDVELTRMEPVEDDPGRHYFAFMVYFAGRAEGVPLSIEETTDGCRIEWTSFVEGKDMLLENFYSSWRREPGTFRVLIRRGHYFETDIPNREGKIYFDINPPDRTGPYPLWLDKDSAVWKQDFAGGDKLPWNQLAMMVLKLQWVRTPKGVEYVRLVEVAADSWHPEAVK